MPHQRAKHKTQTSISMSEQELKEMRAEVARRGLRGVGHLIEEMWLETKKQQSNKKGRTPEK